MLKFDKLVGDDAQGVTERVDVEFDLCHPLSSEVTLFIRSFAGSKCTVLPTVHCVNVFFFSTHTMCVGSTFLPTLYSIPFLLLATFRFTVALDETVPAHIVKVGFLALFI